MTGFVDQNALSKRIEGIAYPSWHPDYGWRYVQVRYRQKQRDKQVEALGSANIPDDAYE
jgi:hypothetical protein